MGSSRAQQGSGGPAGQPSSSNAPAAQPVAVIPAVAMEAEAALTTKATRAAARRAVLATISAVAAPGAAASAGRAAGREAMQQHQQPAAAPYMPATTIQPLPPQALAIQEAIAMDVDDVTSHAAQLLQQAVPAKPSPQAPASSPAASVRRSIGAIAAAAGSAAAAAAARAFSPLHAMDATRVAAATSPAQPGYGVTILDQFHSFQRMPSRPGTAGRGAAATAPTAATPKLQVRADSPDDTHPTSGHPRHLPAGTMPVSGHPSPFPYQGVPPAIKPAATILGISGFKTPKSPMLVDADINGITNKENAVPHRSSMAAKAVAAAASARKAAAGFSSGRKGAGGSWLKSLAGVSQGTGSGHHHLPSRFSIPGAGPSGMHSAGKQHLLHQRFQQHATQSPGLPPAMHAANEFVDPEEDFSAMDYQADAQHVQPAHLAYSPLASGADAAAVAGVQAAPAGMLALGGSPAAVAAMPWALPAIMEEGAQRRPLGALSVAQANAFRNIR